MRQYRIIFVGKDATTSGAEWHRTRASNAHYPDHPSTCCNRKWFVFTLILAYFARNEQLRFATAPAACVNQKMCRERLDIAGTRPRRKDLPPMPEIVGNSVAPFIFLCRPYSDTSSSLLPGMGERSADSANRLSLFHAST